MGVGQEWRRGVFETEKIAHAGVRGKRESYLRNFQWFCVARTQNLNDGVVGAGKWKNLWLEKERPGS